MTVAVNAGGCDAQAPFLSTCQVNCCVPFVGSNRKPTGGNVEVRRLSLYYVVIVICGADTNLLLDLDSIPNATEG